VIEDKRDDILRIANRHGACQVRVFGSVASGEIEPESDVDSLVKIDLDRSLLDLRTLVADPKGPVGTEKVVKRGWCCVQ